MSRSGQAGVLPPAEICMNVLGWVTDASLAEAAGVAVVSGVAYVAADGFLSVVDAGDPTTPVVIGSESHADLGSARAVAISGNYAIVAVSDPFKGLAVVDITTPASPAFETSITGDPDLYGAWDIALSGSYAFIASISAGVMCVVDISDPTAPFIEGSEAHIDLDGPAGVAISGNVCFVTSQNNSRLFAIDITDPTDTSVISNISVEVLGVPNEAIPFDTVDLDSPEGVDVYGDYAYVAMLSGGVVVVDVSDPSAMSVVGAIGSTNYGGAVQVVAAADRLYFVANSDDSVVALDVSTPATPAELDSVTDGSALNAPSDIAKSGALLYVVADNSDSLAIIGCP